MHKGTCNCGAIRFEVSCPLKPPDACHCTRCRRQSGHYFVSTDLPRSAVRIEGSEQLTWFQASEKVRRGFCSVCGCNLFWDPVGHDWIGVAMGAFDNPTGTALGLHIYTENKGDYYEISDAAPQYRRTPRDS
ncbi:GFA family protein [bacterium]|nr:GFA family protein [bacterium]